MSKISKARILLTVAASLLAAPATAQGVGGHLVDVRWLEKNLANPNVLLLDASPGRCTQRRTSPGP